MADGWIPLFVPPDEYAAALERLEKEAEGVGRDPTEIERAIVVFVSVGSSETHERGLAWMSSLYSIAPDAFRRHLIVGDASSAARSVLRYEEAGAQHVAVFVTDDDPLAQFEDLAGELAELR
jgi:alkanesulfonate monooxygenase SsuD/methylene tetrahydromethanopterin reductase-like flavin-dependent oxidoreductase (luciferase family)